MDLFYDLDVEELKESLAFMKKLLGDKDDIRQE
jgi:hypothetical protein